MMKNRRWKEMAALCLIVGATSLFAFSQFLTKPRIWSDEGLNMQMAKNLATFGTIAVQVSPGDLHSFPYTLSTGWVVPTSLAAGFLAAGESFFVARFVMALYLFGFIVALFFLLRRFMPLAQATFGVLLVASFSSFHAYGKSVLGEVPGLFWLTLGLLAYDGLKKNDTLRALCSGLGFGMFFAAKPAFLLVGLPLLVLVHFWCGWKKSLPLSWLALFWVSLLLPAILTLWIGTIHPITFDNLRATIAFYSNNYSSPCISCDILKNLNGFLTQPTFWHLELLLAAAVLWLGLRWREASRDWRVVWFSLFSALTILYFLKSPGTNRYLLPVQLLLLAVFPVCLEGLARRWWPRASVLVLPVCGLLVMVQMYQYVAFSDVLAGDGPPRLERFLRQELPASSGAVGVINAPVAAVSVPSDRLFQFIRNDAHERTDGTNVLTLPENEWPPTIIYMLHEKNRVDIQPYEDRLAALYSRRDVFGAFIVLRK